MLRQVLAVLLAVLLCAAPAEQLAASGTEAGPPSAEAIARAVLDSQPDGDGLLARTGEELDLYLTGLYGFEDQIWSDAAVYAAEGVDGREVAVFRLSSMNLFSKTVADALEEHRKNRAADFSGYVPDQEALLERAKVVTGWGCVALLACEDMDAAVAAFEQAAGGAEVYAPSGLTPADTRWFLPFDPPNAFDMSLYDTSAVVAAYASGDESGLSERDAALLGRCREVLAECVSEGMSDFEKERRVYAWLTAYGEGHQDESVFDPRTPLGQEDNTNPYGVLVRGYGICLGFAATFQLLMDLAEVECVTVVGARKENRQDHAWNMVRLEGEWYCVDPTLDITAWKAYQRYEYFNVTSGYLRRKDFQWDYLSVPEAVATRFCWDGTGEVPQ